MLHVLLLVGTGCHCFLPLLFLLSSMQMSPFTVCTQKAAQSQIPVMTLLPLVLPRAGQRLPVSVPGVCCLHSYTCSATNHSLDLTKNSRLANGDWAEKGLYGMVGISGTIALLRPGLNAGSATS